MLALLLPVAARAQSPAVGQVTPPVVVHHVDPEYPPSALKTREHKDVVVIVTIDVDGHVSKAEIAQSGGEDIDQAALVAAHQWTFTPAMRDGKPVASRIKLRFHFAPPEPPPEIIETKTPPDEMPAHPAVPIASPPAARPSEPSAGTASVENVRVLGKLQRRSFGIADYDVVVGQLKAIPRTNASDFLRLAPGFFLTNEGGAGHAEQVFMRGFDAKEGQDIEWSVDGVPINDAGNYHGNGYADTHFILPELVRSVRVLEGPYAPQQGDFAVAGSVDYQLGLDQRGLTASYSVGTFGTQRFVVLWGPDGAPPGTFAGAEYYTTDGFGVNRQAKRGTAIGQWETAIGQNGALRVNAIVYGTEYNNAGVVREDDYAAGLVDFYGTEDPNQTGNTSTRAQIAATYEGRFKDIDVSQQLFVIDRTMRLRENWTGFLEDVQLPTQTPHGQRGDLLDFHFDEATAGARGFARWHGQAFGLEQEFEAGYFARFDTTHSTQDRVAAGNEQPYAIDADYQSNLGDVGVYADGDVRLLPWLGLRGGVRADTFLFDVLDNCAVTSVDSPSPAFAASEVNVSCLSELKGGNYVEPFLRAATGNGTAMPRGTLVVGPLDHFEFSASAGSGVRSVDPSYVSQGIGTPFATVDSRDLGVAYANSFGSRDVPVSISVKSEFFQTHVGQDQIFDATEGRSTLSSGSTRTGWQGDARVRGPFFDVTANATFVKAVFDTAGDCAPYCGLLVPYVPDLYLHGEAVAFADLPWKIAGQPLRGIAGYGVSYVGRRPLPYGQLSDLYFLSDASLGVSWSIWSAKLSGQNLFDSKYKLGEYNYASNFNKYLPEPTLAPERSFTAGAPRTILLTLSATLGGGA